MDRLDLQPARRFQRTGEQAAGLVELILLEPYLANFL
jgi:hypothetical protein